MLGAAFATSSGVIPICSASPIWAMCCRASASNAIVTSCTACISRVPPGAFASMFSLLGEPTDEPRGLIQIQPGWVGLQFVDSRERAGDAPLDWLDVVVYRFGDPFFFVFRFQRAAAGKEQRRSYHAHSRGTQRRLTYRRPASSFAACWTNAADSSWRYDERGWRATLFPLAASLA